MKNEKQTSEEMESQRNQNTLSSEETTSRRELTEGDFTDLSLDDLRDYMYKRRNRFRERKPMNDAEKAYWERVNATQPDEVRSVEDVLRGAYCRDARPQKQIDRFPISLDDARYIVWQIAKRFMLTERKPFTVDAHNRDVLLDMTKYFIGDDSSSFNLQKGLMICGKVGTGKSFLMKVFRSFASALKNEQRIFRNIGTKQILFEMTEAKNIAAAKKYFTGNYCLDDIGAERVEVKIYGDSVSAIEEILFMRHENYTKFGLITHATTNLMPDDIEDRYGERVGSRLNEMFNFVILQGPDRRFA